MTTRRPTITASEETQRARLRPQVRVARSSDGRSARELTAEPVAEDVPGKPCPGGAFDDPLIWGSPDLADPEVRAAARRSSTHGSIDLRGGSPAGPGMTRIRR